MEMQWEPHTSLQQFLVRLGLDSDGKGNTDADTKLQLTSCQC